jgi:hypothetical protein
MRQRRNRAHAKSQRVKSRYGPGTSKLSNFPQYSSCFFFSLIERAPDRFETLPANSFEANLLLNSATSSAKMYRRFAIKCVRSQPRFSNRHADTLDKPVISQKRCNDIGGMYSGGTVLCEVAEAFNGFMSDEIGRIVSAYQTVAKN